MHSIRLLSFFCVALAGCVDAHYTAPVESISAAVLPDHMEKFSPPTSVATKTAAIEEDEDSEQTEKKPAKPKVLRVYH